MGYTTCLCFMGCTTYNEAILASYMLKHRDKWDGEVTKISGTHDIISDTCNSIFVSKHINPICFVYKRFAECSLMVFFREKNSYTRWKLSRSWFYVWSFHWEFLYTSGDTLISKFSPEVVQWGLTLSVTKSAYGSLDFPEATHYMTKWTDLIGTKSMPTCDPCVEY